MPYIQGKFGKLPEVTKDNQSYFQKMPVGCLHTNITTSVLQMDTFRGPTISNAVVHPTQYFHPLEIFA